ncbi:MAG: hypothetical protein ACYCPQ_08160 [Elusimicrobiota bacterium]
MNKQKIMISLDFPVRWKLIANGERAIEQTGPDSIDVDVREGSVREESWIHTLPRLLDEAISEMRRRCEERRSGFQMTSFSRVAASKNH